MTSTPERITSARSDALHDLGRQTGDLRYDALQMLLNDLAAQLGEHSQSVASQGRTELSKALSAAGHIRLAADEVKKADDISLTFLADYTQSAPDVSAMHTFHIANWGHVE